MMMIPHRSKKVIDKEGRRKNSLHLLSNDETKFTRSKLPRADVMNKLQSWVKNIELNFAPKNLESHHSSVVLSAPTILQPRVRIPSKPSTLSAI